MMESNCRQEPLLAGVFRKTPTQIFVEKRKMSIGGSRQKVLADFHHGQLVTVRSLDEILATLDAEARLEGMPFMPEMVPLCGQTVRIHRRAERTCVEGIGLRSLQNTVFLEGLRCDGSSHGGCQRGCLFFWKSAWLKPAAGGADQTGKKEPPEHEQPSIRSRPHAPQLPTTKGDRFYCQSTELARATGELSHGKLRHYLHDLRIGEMRPRRFIYLLWRALANRAWKLLRGRGYYDVSGQQSKTFTAELNLQAGELVEIKSAAEIEATLDAKGRNRGLSFEPEMALHCGRRYRVAAPLHTIIAEDSGKMVQLTNTVILEGLVCQGICLVNCPRANYFYWREIWLKRVAS
jgi:hypothetical protein